MDRTGVEMEAMTACAVAAPDHLRHVQSPWIRSMVISGRVPVGEDGRPLGDIPPGKFRIASHNRRAGLDRVHVGLQPNAGSPVQLVERLRRPLGLQLGQERPLATAGTGARPCPWRRPRGMEVSVNSNSPLEIPI